MRPPCEFLTWLCLKRIVVPDGSLRGGPEERGVHFGVVGGVGDGIFAGGFG